MSNSAIIAPNKSPAEGMDKSDFRKAMSAFATGVAIVTTKYEGELQGMTINSMTSVSLQPCQLLFCANHGSTTAQAIKARGLFAINIMAQHQMQIAQTFARYHPTRFETCAYSLHDFDLPIFDQALAAMICSCAQIITSGDHDIFIGNVLSCITHPGEPLLYYASRYASLAPQT
jgi:3-hydroxy-9,10-secoandrosta-1,3,5(10)-triene-9,17-dione monooxygenase reductase component